MRIAFPKLSRPFTAALVLSSAVHAAIALAPPDAAPLTDQLQSRPGSSQGRPLRVTLTLPRSNAEPMSQAAVATSPRKRASPSLAQVPAVARTTAAAPNRAPRPRDTAREKPGMALERFAERPSESATRPTPLSYPILVLPPGDDPHRVGLVRLMLVVSSEGKVANVIVMAATMSQDYIDLVTKSFEEMRFNPGMLRGAPHPGWYEVVVNFGFEPQGAALL